jgi:GrpB-like predicted nucleotidyltransferase (UPF0157 family)
VQERVLTEDQIRAATIGEPRLLNATIRLVPYDPAWPSRFEREAQRIRAALGERVLLLEHVGSTSVPGLCAKPVIDIVLAVANSADEGSYVSPLEARGYALRIREPAWFEHRMLCPEDAEAHVHVFSAGCEEVGRMLAFRDHLRAREEDRELYAQTKRSLAARIWRYAQNYADAKTEIVGEILARAMPQAR